MFYEKPNLILASAGNFAGHGRSQGSPEKNHWPCIFPVTRCAALFRSRCSGVYIWPKHAGRLFWLFFFFFLNQNICSILTSSVRLISKVISVIKTHHVLTQFHLVFVCSCRPNWLVSVFLLTDEVDLIAAMHVEYRWMGEEDVTIYPGTSFPRSSSSPFRWGHQSSVPQESSTSLGRPREPTIHLRQQAGVPAFG